MQKKSNEANKITSVHCIGQMNKPISPHLEMTSANRSIARDDENGKIWDRCLTDAVIKTGFGLTWGIIFSALLFKRRPWPIFFGTGIGIGMGYSNCQNNLRASCAQSKSITRSD